MSTNGNGKRSVGAPNGNQNALTHGLVKFNAEVKRRSRRGRSLIDRRSAAGKNAVAIGDQLLADLGGEENCSTAKLMLIEMIRRDTYFCDEIDKRIFKTMYKVTQINPDTKRYGAKGLATLYGYRTTVVNNLARNLQLLGLERLPPKQKTLDEILSESEDEREEP